MPNAQYRRIDFYKQFGLKDFADIEEVKLRYRTLVLKHHPDRGGNEEKMKIVNRIYEILTKEKELYDAWLKRQLQPVFPNFRYSVIITPGWSYSGTTATNWY